MKCTWFLGTCKSCKVKINKLPQNKLERKKMKNNPTEYVSVVRFDFQFFSMPSNRNWGELFTFSKQPCIKPPRNICSCLPMTSVSTFCAPVLEYLPPEDDLVYGTSPEYCMKPHTEK